jgi:hypothetical protein
MHASRFQDVVFLSRTLGKADVPRDCTVQPTRLCGTSTPTSTSRLRFTFSRVFLILVSCVTTQVTISPFFYPVSAATFNFACTIFGSVSIFAILSWYFIPPDKWLRQEQIERALRTAEGHPDVVEPPTVLQGGGAM